MLFRTLKKIHFLDLIGMGIFFGILAVAAFFFLRRSDYVTLTLRISESDSYGIWSKPPLWYANTIQTGMKSEDMLGRSTLEVIDVYRYMGEEASSLTYIQLKLRAVYNKRTNEYSYNGSNLLIGSYQQFRIQGVLVTGIVHTIHTQAATEKKRFLLKGYINPSLVDTTALSAETISTGIPNFLSKKIVEGMTVKDSRGTILAEIKKVKKSQAQRKFIYNGQLTQFPDVNLEKVDLEVEVTAEKNGTLYFYRQDSPMLINTSIYFYFDELILPMLITEIVELP